MGRRYVQTKSNGIGGVGMVRPVAIGFFAFVATSLFCGHAFANPYIPDLYGGSRGGPLWFVASSCLAVEYLLLRYLLRDEVSFRLLLYAFLLINGLSFPLMVIVGSSGASWFAECVPVALEPPLYVAFFRQYGQEIPRVSRKIIGVNLASFLLGLATYWALVAVQEN